jgi:hypothetical protein
LLYQLSYSGICLVAHSIMTLHLQGKHKINPHGLFLIDDTP